MANEVVGGVFVCVAYTVVCTNCTTLVTMERTSKNCIYLHFNVHEYNTLGKVYMNGTEPNLRYVWLEQIYKFNKLIR